MTETTVKITPGDLGRRARVRRDSRQDWEDFHDLIASDASEDGDRPDGSESLLEETASASDGRPVSSRSGDPGGRPVPVWKSKASRTRRAFTIHGYIGANGHGKSLAMMHDTKLSMDLGRPILSTVKVLDPSTGETYRNYVPFRQWSQLLDFTGGDVLMDEVIGVAASASGSALPMEVQLLLNQLRRRDILLRWTAPSWSRANIVLREVTQAVTVCRGYFPKYEASGDGSRMWGMNRLFRWTTYDAMEFTTWTDNKEANLKGKANAWSWRSDKMWAARSYDTFDSVENVDSGHGFCFRCHGERPKIKREPCSCVSE